MARPLLPTHLRKTQVTFSLTPQMLQRLNDRAYSDRTTISDLVRQGLCHVLGCDADGNDLALLVEQHAVPEE